MGKYAQLEEEGRLISIQSPSSIHKEEEKEDPRSVKPTPKTVPRKRRVKSGENRDQEGADIEDVPPPPPPPKRGPIRYPGTGDEQALLISNLYYDSIALIDVSIPSSLPFLESTVPLLPCRNWRQISVVFLSPIELSTKDPRD